MKICKMCQLEKQLSEFTRRYRYCFFKNKSNTTMKLNKLCHTCIDKVKRNKKSQ